MEMSKSQEALDLSSAPEGLAQWDNQANSAACVRFAIAKAVANHLYVKRSIDVAQNEIMILLVREKKSICAISPMEYDGTTLCLPDIDNDKKGYKPKSWWEVTLLK